MAKRKLKLPKRIAGVKILKAVRKGPVGQFLNSSAGQVLVAEALIAATGTLVMKNSNPDSAVRHPVRSLKRLGRSASERGDDARLAIERNSARLSFAFGEGVRAFRAALEHEPLPRGEGVLVTETPSEVEPAKKKQSARTEDGRH
jgi:hypothetical protein